MSISIKYKDNIVVTADSGDTITIHCTNKKFSEDLVIESSASGSSSADSPLPVEVSTEAEMTALLTSGEVGGVYKYTGTTGTYQNGALYVLEEVAVVNGYTVIITAESTNFSSEAFNDVTVDLTFLDGSTERIEYWEEGTFYNVVSITVDGYCQFLENGSYNHIEAGTYNLISDITIDKVYYQSCIDENTLVTMADGTTKLLGQVEVGDEVLSIDFDTKELVVRKVIYSGKDEPDYPEWYVDSYWENVYSDGTVIKQAMKHRFYNLENESYVYLNYWNIGEHTYKLDGSNPYLVSRTLKQGRLHYARITLETSNNYFANGLSTGDRNCCPNKVVLDAPLPRRES